MYLTPISTPWPKTASPKHPPSPNITLNIVHKLSIHWHMPEGLHTYCSLCGEFSFSPSHSRMVCALTSFRFLVNVSSSERLSPTTDLKQQFSPHSFYTPPPLHPTLFFFLTFTVHFLFYCLIGLLHQNISLMIMDFVLVHCSVPLVWQRILNKF